MPIVDRTWNNGAKGELIPTTGGNRGGGGVQGLYSHVFAGHLINYEGNLKK